MASIKENRVVAFLARTHWPLLLVTVALMAVGVAAINVSEMAEGAGTRLLTRQIIYACVGVAAFLFVSAIPYQRIGRLAYPMFGVAIVLLVLVLLPKVGPLQGPLRSLIPTIRGSTRWFDLTLGKQKLLVQPSEIAKLAYIIMLAWYLRHGDEYRRLRGLITPLLLTLAPMVLILIEPDLGTCLLLLPTLYIMLFMAGARLRHLLGIAALALVFLFTPIPRNVSSPMGAIEAGDRGTMAYHWDGQPWTFHAGGSEYVVSAAPLAVMKHHQLKRIEGWLRQGDDEVARGKGYQLYQSKMILGTGHWGGRASRGDADSYFRLLPDDHTDFIFSVVGGQWGLAGGIVIMLLYAAIFAICISTAVRTHDAFGRLLAVGVLALLFSQVCINVGMTMGLMPITGMTLPLVSYGGSSLVMNCGALGLVAGVSRQRPMLLSKRPFEYDY